MYFNNIPANYCHRMGGKKTLKECLSSSFVIYHHLAMTKQNDITYKMGVSFKKEKITVKTGEAGPKTLSTYNF